MLVCTLTVSNMNYFSRMLKFDLFSIFKGTNDMITQETYIIVLEKKIGQYPVMTLHMH